MTIKKIETVSDLIKILNTIEEDVYLVTVALSSPEEKLAKNNYSSFYSIDFDFDQHAVYIRTGEFDYSKSITKKEALAYLIQDKINPNFSIEMDIEDGYIYRPVTQVIYNNKFLILEAFL